MTGETQSSSLDDRIETIEKTYEFMLAYAAQGHDGDQGEGAGSEIRDFLERAHTALAGLESALSASVAERTADPQPYQAFLAITGVDARKAQAAMELVLAQPSISSQLVDNLNASIHLRALLTDLFLIDEALKSGGR